MKRKTDANGAGADANSIVARKLSKLTKTDRPCLISGKKLKNFVEDNTLQDWLEMHRPIRRLVPEKWREWRMEQFRKHVIAFLAARFHVHALPRRAIDGAVAIDAVDTIEAMKDGHQVIVNAVLIDRIEGFCEVDTILIRSDAVLSLYPELSGSLQEARCSFAKHGIWYYIPLVLTVDWEHTLYGDLDTYCQDPYIQVTTDIQNRVLDKYQHCQSQVGLVMSRCHPLDVPILTRCGEPNIAGYRKWAGKLASSQHWTVAPPSVPELAANDQISESQTPYWFELHKISLEQNGGPGPVTSTEPRAGYYALSLETTAVWAYQGSQALCTTHVTLASLGSDHYGLIPGDARACQEIEHVLVRDLYLALRSLTIREESCKIGHWGQEDIIYELGVRYPQYSLLEFESHFVDLSPQEDFSTAAVRLSCKVSTEWELGELALSTRDPTLIEAFLEHHFTNQLTLVQITQHPCRTSPVASPTSPQSSVGMDDLFDSDLDWLALQYPAT